MDMSPLKHSLALALLALSPWGAAGCMGGPEEGGGAGEEIATTSQAATTTPTEVFFAPVSAVNGGIFSKSGFAGLGPLPRGLVVTIDGCSSQSHGDTILSLVRLEGGSLVSLGPGFSNDDGCGVVGGSDRIDSVTIPTSGEYYVKVDCFTGSCASAVHAFTATSVEQRWAPAIYQDVWPTSGWGYQHDWLTRVNYDNDYSGRNNDTSFPPPPLSLVGQIIRPFVYVSRVETSTHFFLSYAFYHPMDRNHDGPNDLEGAIVSIRKAGLFGRFDAWLMEAHGPLHANGPSWHRGEVNGQLALYVEPRGHGVYTCLERDCGNNDGVIYLFEGGRIDQLGVAPESECGFGRQTFFNTATCGYGLIAMEESGGLAPGASGSVDQGLWHLRNHIGAGKMFESCGVFQSGNDKANAPWNWDGRFLSDPAALFSAWGFANAPFSTSYASNAFRAFAGPGDTCPAIR
jgi:hypothetical protein